MSLQRDKELSRDHGSQEIASGREALCYISSSRRQAQLLVSLLSIYSTVLPLDSVRHTVRRRCSCLLFRYTSRSGGLVRWREDRQKGWLRRGRVHLYLTGTSFKREACCVAHGRRTRQGNSGVRVPPLLTTRDASNVHVMC